MNKEAILRDFFDTALKGESKTYNDHNWYAGNTLRSYIEGVSSNPYSLLKKPLSEYTIGDVIEFQERPRDNKGQLWATGRYQIIPSTLKGIYKNAGLSLSDKYNKLNQDKLGYELMLGRKDLRSYIKGEIPDTTQNLQKAALNMAMIWSSIGVPYNVNGKQKNQSYYASDKASVNTEDIQAKLKELRKRLNTKIITNTQNINKRNITKFILPLFLLFSGVMLLIYRKKIVSLITKL